MVFALLDCLQINMYVYGFLEKGFLQKFQKNLSLVVHPRSKVLISVYNWVVHISLLTKTGLFIFHCLRKRFHFPEEDFFARVKDFVAQEIDFIALMKNFLFV